jgi:hypothetical protein
MLMSPKEIKDLTGYWLSENTLAYRYNNIEPGSNLPIDRRKW